VIGLDKDCIISQVKIVNLLPIEGDLPCSFHLLLYFLINCISPVSRVYRRHFFYYIMKFVRVFAVHDQLVAVNLGCFDQFDTFVVLFFCRFVIHTIFDEVLLVVLKGARLRN
jgi:hypothetical protein